MNFDLQQDARSHTLIAAHRGVSGGNIPGNTLAAFEAALFQGADMIELDVTCSRDGELFVFHPGMEPVFLRSETRLGQLCAEEIRRLRYVNGDATPTQYGVNTFDEALEALKGRCYINVDKFQDNPEKIVQAIRRHGMEAQILIKSPPREDMYRFMEQCAPNISYMVVLRDQDDQTEQLRKRQIRYVGVEALFATEDVPLATAAYVEQMHSRGLLVWANAIVYNHREVLTAGHNDDVSITGRTQAGWGWLLDRGYDVIQTDWPQSLRQFIQQRRS